MQETKNPSPNEQMHMLKNPSLVQFCASRKSRKKGNPNQERQMIKHLVLIRDMESMKEQREIGKNIHESKCSIY
jgi:hypothetical protein